MSASEDEQVISPKPLPRRKGIKRNLGSPPLSLSQPANSKRNRTLSVGRNRTASVGNRPHLSVMSLENVHLSNKLEKLMNMVSEINTKVQKIDNIEKVVNDLQEKFLTYAPPIDSEQLLQTIKEDVQELKANVSKISEMPLMSTQDALTDTALAVGSQDANVGEMDTSPPVEDETPKLSEIIPNLENDFLKPRAREFYKGLHNGDRLDIHKNWLSDDPPFIPPNYLPKKMSYIESEAEYKIRKAQKLKDLEHYMELLHVKRDMGKAACDSLDSEASRLINDSENSPEVKEKLKQEYLRKARIDEEKSRSEWNKKGKKGVQELKERAENRIVKEGDRVYKVVNKKSKSSKENVPVKQPSRGKTDAPSKSKKPNQRNDASKAPTVVQNNGTLNQGTQPGEPYLCFVPNVPLNVSVPPPQLPFRWIYPQGVPG